MNVRPNGEETLSHRYLGTRSASRSHAVSEPGETSADKHYLLTALDYAGRRVDSQLTKFLGKKSEAAITLGRPQSSDVSPFANFVRRYELNADEVTLLVLALAPHIIPGFFDQLVHRNLPNGGEIVEFGGIKGKNHRGTIATGETALFVLAGMDPVERLASLPAFDDEQFLFRQKILSLEAVNSNEPRLSGSLLMEKEFIDVFTTGKVALPGLSMSFPAENITTDMEWDDLVLSEPTLLQIHEIEDWINYHGELMEGWGMNRTMKPGFRVLFYGAPGTGKTLAATLLGKYTSRPVFRIDLSMVMSKYIGETEKNLAVLFNKAEHKDWILLFDEADAIFGKRTGVRDANDKYANQEVSYLLQRIESHAGLSILASNFKSNIDQAFIRRFNAMIYFPIPGYRERLSLWQRAFPKGAPLARDVSYEKLAVDHELTGSQIMNIVQHTCLQSLACSCREINMVDIEHGVRRELAKEGK